MGPNILLPTEYNIDTDSSYLNSWFSFTYKVMQSWHFVVYSKFQFYTKNKYSSNVHILIIEYWLSEKYIKSTEDI